MTLVIAIILWLLLGQCVLLALIGRAIRAHSFAEIVQALHRMTDVLDKEQSVVVEPSPVPINIHCGAGVVATIGSHFSDLPPAWETLEWRGQEWVHVGFVRENSPVWARLRNDPQVALRSPDGVLHEGGK